MRNLWNVGAALLLSSGVVSVGSLSAQERPKYQFLRQNEDWSWLAGKDTSSTGDFWDPYKYFALNEDGTLWASLGGSLRLRYEAWDNFNFGAAPAGVETDDGFLLTRIRAHADVHYGEDFRAFVEFKGAYAGDRRLVGGRRTLDSDTAALQQAFVDINLGDEDYSLILRPGRQMLLLGSQRLVSPLGWSNTLRTWDGVSAILKMDQIQVQGFWAYFAPVQKYSFNDGDQDIQLYGVFLTGKCAGGGGEPEWVQGYDLYVLGVSNDGATFNGTTGHEDRVTLGGRAWGKLGGSGFDYEVEAAWQVGEVGSGDINAYMFAGNLGYPLVDSDWDPKFHVGLDIASGDRSPGGDVQTFNQMYPLGHAFLGYIDTIGRQNIIDLHAGVTVTPVEKLVAEATWHQFWLMDDDDALYNAGGGIVRPGGVTGSTSVGSELDITFKYPVDRHIKLLVGYSHFFDGHVLEQSGTHKDIDFAYVQAEYTF